MSESCKNCAEMDVNIHSDEAYCNLADDREIVLKKGQHRPKWCPKKKDGEQE